MIRIACVLAIIVCGSAAAHDLGAPSAAEPVGWSFEAPVLVPLAFSALLYALGTFRLWSRAGLMRGGRVASIVMFSCGWAVLAAALVSPLHSLSNRLFAAHMVEHQLLMEVSAPLLVLSHPLGALMWGLPKGWRVKLRGAAQAPPIAWLWGWLRRPLVATILHGIAIWAWHTPVLFREALAHEWVHWLQHASFFGTALLFWWAIIRADAAGRARGIGHLFATSVHTSLLGALLVFSSRPWFEMQSGGASAWGLTALDDQQLAGLIMWIPGGLLYAAAALALAGALLTDGRKETLRGPL